MKKNICTLFLIGMLIAAVSGCGGNKSSTNYNNPTTTGGSTNTPVLTAAATIQNFAFSPSTIYLKPGGTVTWTNKDATAHTVTDNGGPFDSGNLAVDQVYSYTFPSTSGTYTYHCKLHSMMASATVIVGN